MVRHPQGHVFYRTMAHDYPVVERGEGVYLYDTQGRRYLDASGGPVVVNIGHGVPSIAEALAAQAARVACAAIAAHLLPLTPEQTRHALGIADYHAPNLPMMRDIDHPSMVKHGIGWGAMTGITAAQLAARGFAGIPSLFSFDEYQGWVADVGQHYIMANGLARKEYACCAWDHAAMQAAEQLTGQHNIQPEEIAYPQQGWSEECIESKFRWLAVHRLDEARVDELVDLVWHFEQVSAVPEFARLVA